MDALLPFSGQLDTPHRPELGITHLGAVPGARRAPIGRGPVTTTPRAPWPPASTAGSARSRTASRSSRSSPRSPDTGW